MQDFFWGGSIWVLLISKCPENIVLMLFCGRRLEKWYSLVYAVQHMLPLTFRI